MIELLEGPKEHYTCTEWCEECRRNVPVRVEVQQEWSRTDRLWYLAGAAIVGVVAGLVMATALMGGG